MSRRKTSDPLLDEVDEMRQSLLDECDNDPKKVLESYYEYQKQFADRLVDYGKDAHPDKSAA